jgi:hypothetical protein
MAPLIYHKHFLAAPRPEDCAVPEKAAFSVTSRLSLLTHPLKYSADAVILLMVGRHYFPLYNRNFPLQVHFKGQQMYQNYILTEKNTFWASHSCFPVRSALKGFPEI